MRGLEGRDGADMLRGPQKFGEERARPLAFMQRPPPGGLCGRDLGCTLCRLKSGLSRHSCWGGCCSCFRRAGMYGLGALRAGSVMQGSTGWGGPAERCRAAASWRSLLPRDHLKGVHHAMSAWSSWTGAAAVHSPATAARAVCASPGGKEWRRRQERPRPCVEGAVGWRWRSTGRWSGWEGLAGLQLRMKGSRASAMWKRLR
jgi:hypothetical protein